MKDHMLSAYNQDFDMRHRFGKFLMRGQRYIAHQAWTVKRYEVKC